MNRVFSVSAVFRKVFGRTRRLSVTVRGGTSAGSFTALAHNTQPVEFGLEQRDRAQFRITPEDQPGSRSLRLIHHQFAVLDVIAERHVAAHPHALALRGRNLVADALAG